MAAKSATGGNQNLLNVMWCRDHHLACLIIDPLVSMANLHRETQSEPQDGRSVSRWTIQLASTEKTMNHDLVNVLVVKVKHPHTSWPCPPDDHSPRSNKSCRSSPYAFDPVCLPRDIVEVECRINLVVQRK